jgi:hypothetical protein
LGRDDAFPAFGTEALAWGQEGPSIVTEIAEQQLGRSQPKVIDWPGGSNQFIQYCQSGHIVELGRERRSALMGPRQFVSGRKRTSPTVATANPTLRLAGLAFRTAEKIKTSLNLATP